MTEKEFQKQVESLTDQEKFALLEELSNKLNVKIPRLEFFQKKWIYESVSLNQMYGIDWLGMSIVIDNQEIIKNNKHLVDAKFYYLFINCDYGRDLSGYRPHFNWCPSFLFSSDENEENVSFLKNISEQWESVITKQNHQDTYLQIVCAETRKILKEELEAVKHDGFLRQKSIKKNILLYYKYLYLKGLLLFSNELPFTIKIDNKLVCYDFESLIHLGRHFAQSIKSGLTNKSYFTQDFEFTNLHNKLKEIFSQINSSNCQLVPLSKDNNQLFFKYNNIQYTLWVVENKDPKSEFKYRVGSFYPTTSQDELRKSAQLTMVKVTDDLTIFQN